MISLRASRGIAKMPHRLLQPLRAPDARAGPRSTARSPRASARAPFAARRARSWPIVRRHRPRCGRTHTRRRAPRAAAGAAQRKHRRNSSGSCASAARRTARAHAMQAPDGGGRSRARRTRSTASRSASVDGRLRQAELAHGLRRAEVHPLAGHAHRVQRHLGRPAAHPRRAFHADGGEPGHSRRARGTRGARRPVIRASPGRSR